MTNDVQGSHVPDYVALGFEQIDRDLKFLVGCFREVLVELGHERLAVHLPWIGDPPSDTDVKELPEELGLGFAVAFQLLNMVEESAAASMRRLREMHEGLSAERGLWGSHLSSLKEQSFAAAEITRIMKEIRVEPVLTAHPTEAKRLAVLDQHRALFTILEERTQHQPTPSESDSMRDRTKATLERLWRTGEILLEKPSLTDERRNVLHYLRDVFPRVLPQLDERLSQAWLSVGFDSTELPEPLEFPQIRFGTWVGGDRDGHPGVTAEITAETLERLRVNALLVLQRALSELAEKLSLSAWMQAPPSALVEARERSIHALGSDAESVLATNKDEPWRQFIHLMITRLPVVHAPHTLAKLRQHPGVYEKASELFQDLLVLRESLVSVGALRLIERDLRPVERLLDIFGFHLAQLDIRQNSVFHAKALAQLMNAAGIDGSQWEEWLEVERVRFLEKELRSPRPFLHASASAGPEADAVVGCYRVLAAHIDKYGFDGLGSLIVSMTRRVSDLLLVYVLAREAGLTRTLPDGPVCVLPVVPLFETGEDLAAAPAILQGFLEQPFTRRSLSYLAHIQGRSKVLPTQQVMIGYSDSNKDAGILASQLALQKAQARLAALGREAGIRLRFFHGRGGTISRGAGPTHRFLEALPQGSLSGDIRLTEQGETIAQKFGNFATAAYNLELLVAGVTATTLRHSRQAREEDALAPILDQLATTSRKAYRRLLEADGFLQFYRQATPIDALEHSSIGSRPSRRTGQPSLADLRAIPWVFSWNQARYYVPGWFGAGSGLATLDASQRNVLSENIRARAFVHYVFTNVESSLASSDLELMRAYAGLVKDDEVRSRIFAMIEEEWHLTQRMLQELRGGQMGSRRPRFARTLDLRADALRVLHGQQIHLLSRWRALGQAGDQVAADAMLPQLLLSINAIASGLRTTG
jgi:phosphoenolpyruvate carboxylase